MTRDANNEICIRSYVTPVDGVVTIRSRVIRQAYCPVCGVLWKRDHSTETWWRADDIICSCCKTHLVAVWSPSVCTKKWNMMTRWARVRVEWLNRGNWAEIQLEQLLEGLDKSEHDLRAEQQAYEEDKEWVQWRDAKNQAYPAREEWLKNHEMERQENEKSIRTVAEEKERRRREWRQEQMKMNAEIRKRRRLSRKKKLN